MTIDCCNQVFFDLAKSNISGASIHNPFNTLSIQITKASPKIFKHRVTVDYPLILLKYQLWVGGSSEYLFEMRLDRRMSDDSRYVRLVTIQRAQRRRRLKEVIERHTEISLIPEVLWRLRRCLERVWRGVDSDGFGPIEVFLGVK